MLEENAEEIGIALRELLLDGVGQSVRRKGSAARVLLDAEGDVRGLPAGRRRQHIDVELRDDDLNAELGEGRDGGVHLLDGGPVHVVVALQADRRDRERPAALSFVISAMAPLRLASFSRL